MADKPEKTPKPDREPAPHAGGSPERHDDDGQIRRRYMVGVRKIRPEDRDVSGPVLRGPHARYRNIMRADDNPNSKVGEDAAFDVWLTDDEARAFAEASNVRYVERDQLIPPALLSTPSTATLAWMNASLAQQGALTGSGVKVAVLDGGTTAAMRAQFSWTMVAKLIVPAGLPPGTENMGDHGCKVASAAMPPAAQLLDAMVAAFADGSAYDTDMAIGLVWACDQGAKVANLSFGSLVGGIAQALIDAFGYARDRGVQVTIAAGNDSATELAAPAIATRQFPNVHAIGAVDKSTNAMATFSNRNADLSGVAPGVSEPGADASGAAINWNGTSCAAPMAAQLIALLCTGGTYTPQQAADALRTTARDLGLGAAVQGRGAWSLSHAKAQLALTPGGKVFRASRSSNQIIPNSTDTRLAFDTVESSDSAVTPNAGKDVFTLNQAGDYEVTVGFRWGGGGSAPGDREVHIGPNIPWGSPGGKMWAPWSEKGSTSPLMDTISTTIKVPAGQQIAAWAWQNCGGAWTMEYAAAHPDNRLLSLAIRYLGT